jgi:hypothetical protein
MEWLAAILPKINGDAVQRLNVLLKKLKVKCRLWEFDFKQDVNPAADMAMSNPYYNPRKLERKPLGEERHTQARTRGQTVRVYEKALYVQS